jgi:aspartyl-tRNA(Asn)/glutamyl-tRNA(Gln) amidotransferase subunit A
MIQATASINVERIRTAVKAAYTFRDVDVLVTPTQPSTALKVGQSVSRIGQREESAFAVSARLLISSLPAASIPYAFLRKKMPIGLQIIGMLRRSVLKIADGFERSKEWHLKYPPIVGSRYPSACNLC